MDFTKLKKLSIGGVELKQLFIDGIQVWKAGYKNWVRYSTEADGVTIYNGGLGYKNGYRLSSSGSLSEQSGTTTTGFISVTGTDVIRMGGIPWIPAGPNDGASRVSYISFFDASFAVLGSYNVAVVNGQGVNTPRGIVTSCVVTTDDNVVTTFEPKFSDVSNIAYVRLNGWGDGANMIVTINEEITE